MNIIGDPDVEIGVRIGVLRLVSFLTFKPPGLSSANMYESTRDTTHPEGSRRGGGLACLLSPSVELAGAPNMLIGV